MHDCLSCCCLLLLMIEKGLGHEDNTIILSSFSAVSWMKSMLEFITLHCFSISFFFFLDEIIVNVYYY
jgi:hypothetical protein